MKSQKYNQKYRLTPKGKYTHQKISAKERGISFLLSFEEWWDIWEKSGVWEQRGRCGYQMCRKNDDGPYSLENVYIAHHTQNKRDAWFNGKTFHPPIGAKKGKIYSTREESLGHSINW